MAYDFGRRNAKAAERLQEAGFTPGAHPYRQWRELSGQARGLSRSQALGQHRQGEPSIRQLRWEGERIPARPPRQAIEGERRRQYGPRPGRPGPSGLPERYVGEPGLAELWSQPVVPWASFDELSRHHVYAGETFATKEEALRHLENDAQLRFAVNNGMVRIVRVGRGITAEYQIWADDES